MRRKNNLSLSLTFDVEEWLSPEEHNFESRFNRNTEFSRLGCIKILDLLKSYNIKTTFFITGYFAEREPHILRMIDNAGHEIASHAYCHTNLTKQSEDNLKTNIERSSKILSGLVSQEIKGFRAPGCYINQDIIDILSELGYQYDSSIHPAIVPGHYYNWKYPLKPYFPSRDDLTRQDKRRLLEIPISVIPLIRLPISWWWMRNIGLWLTRFGTNINLLQNRNVILYFHAWEFVKLPHIKGLPLPLIKHCGDEFLDKLEKFISLYMDKFQFRPLKELAAEHLEDS